MSFVITSGGTAGHIYPALAVAAELQQRGKEVVFAGSIGGMEERLASQAGLKYQAFAAKGFDRQKPFSLLSSSLILARSTKVAQQWLHSINARAVAAFGGYVSVPVGRAAGREGIALLVHEQNSTMGWANKHLSKNANIIALTYAAAADNLGFASGHKVKITGNPVRPEFAQLARPEQALALRQSFRKQLGFNADNLVLLVFGGSQGARHINQAVTALAAELLERPQLRVLHLTGPKELASVNKALSGLIGTVPGTVGTVPQWQTLGYCNQMPAAFAAADIVLSRAGASSLAELAVAAKPALLIPYPYATANHQQKNAESLVKSGAAQMVLDSQLDSPIFANSLLQLIDDAKLRQSMLQAAQSQTHANAAAEVTELLLSLA